MAASRGGLLDISLRTQLLKMILERVPQELDDEDVAFLIAHPQEIDQLLHPIGEFRAPVPARSHHYGPIITVSKERDLRAVLTNWLRGGKGLSAAYLSALVREQSRAVGKHFRPYVMECDQAETTTRIRKAATRQGWRPGRAFELVLYLHARPNEPDGSRRLISLDENDGDNQHPFLALTSDDGRYSAAFIDDEGSWKKTDHFFMVRDEED